jgi:hypothetical protein
MSSGIAAARPAWNLELSAGALEALKWIGVGLMVVDHINAYVYAWKYPALYAAGRVAFPVFAFVLAYNLARPGNERAVDRAFMRLMLFGVAAQFFSMSLRRGVEPDGAWWQLNVLLTFGLAAVLIQMTRGPARWYTWAFAAFATALAGAFVEFHWPGLIYVVAAYHYCARRTPASCGVWLASTAALTLENGNAWALASIPLLFWFRGISPAVPRLKWTFYAFYPLHLAGLWTLTRFV